MRFSLLAATATALIAAPTQAATVEQSLKADMPSLMAMYRDFHANPELSMQEVRTPAKLAAEMKKLGFTVTEKVGKTGVVAVLKNGAGPTLMIRADMDGLPIVEQTGLPYASKVRAMARSGVETGVMHGCGHDTHITSWIGTARLLAALVDIAGQYPGGEVLVVSHGGVIRAAQRAIGWKMPKLPNLSGSWFVARDGVLSPGEAVHLLAGEHTAHEAL